MLGFRGLGFRVQGLGFGGLGFRVQGLGFGGLGFRVEGLDLVIGVINKVTIAIFNYSSK